MTAIRHGCVLALWCALACAQPKDAVIEDARRAARSYASQLPDFLVRQVTARDFNVSAVQTEWTPIDVVTAEVACVNGKEEYRSIMVNGKPANGPLENAGAWSKGEFSSTLEDLFSPATAAEFERRGPGQAGGRNAIRYDFKVPQRNSHWKVRAGAASCTPAYKGSVWIDTAMHRVLRIERRTLGLPAGGCAT
jgi:hypothetical protein